MSTQVNGIIHGDWIELEHSPGGLPEGARVLVDLSLREPVENPHQLIDNLCGAWADDSSLTTIFDQIAANRRHAGARPVSFDDPS
jgi:hypothetical protein